MIFHISLLVTGRVDPQFPEIVFQIEKTIYIFYANKNKL